MTQLKVECRDAMKQAIKGYRLKVDQAKTRIQDVLDEYGEEASKMEHEKQVELLKNARSEAEEAIKTACNRAVEFVQRTGKLDGTKLTDDAKLLDAGLVDVDTFNEWKSKYQENSTMLTAMKRYGERKNAEAIKEALQENRNVTEIPFMVKDISLPGDRVQNWSKLQKQAFDSLSAIDGSGQYADDWNRSAGMAFLDASIDSFGEGADL